MKKPTGSGVALEALDRDEVGEELRHLVQFGDLALDEERHLIRVKAAGKVVQSYLDDVLADLFRVVGIVGEGLYVGDENEHPVIVALVLEEDTVPEGAYVMAQVKFTGRAVTGKNDSSHKMI